MSADIIGNKDGFLMRLAKAEDVTDYYIEVTSVRIGRVFL